MGNEGKKKLDHPWTPGSGGNTFGCLRCGLSQSNMKYYHEGVDDSRRNEESSTDPKDVEAFRQQFISEVEKSAARKREAAKPTAPGLFDQGGEGRYGHALFYRGKYTGARNRRVKPDKSYPVEKPGTMEKLGLDSSRKIPPDRS